MKQQTRYLHLNRPTSCLKSPATFLLKMFSVSTMKFFYLSKNFITTYKSTEVEYEIVVMDLASGKLLRNEKLENWSSHTEDIQMQVGIILTDRPSAPTETIFFNVSEVKINKNTGDAYSDKLSEKYYSYSYRTGLLTELPDMCWQSADDAGQSDKPATRLFLFCGIRS